jgi:hypothetical protein
MHEALEEVLLSGIRGAPGILERLVRREVLAGAGQFEAATQISRDRP